MTCHASSVAMIAMVASACPEHCSCRASATRPLPAGVMTATVSAGTLQRVSSTIDARVSTRRWHSTAVCLYASISSSGTNGAKGYRNRTSLWGTAECNIMNGITTHTSGWLRSFHSAHVISWQAPCSSSGRRCSVARRKRQVTPRPVLR